MQVCFLQDEDDIAIPRRIDSFDRFRRWARSDEFPERGRIDYIDGVIEVDPVTEDVFAHGSPKAEIARMQLNRVKATNLGHVFLDCTRVSCPEANLSVEPDIVVVSHASLDEGIVRFVKSRSGKSRRYVEIEGAPDLITEVLSDASVEKDTERLFKQYFAAGVREYWIVDARGEELELRIHRRSARGFARATRDKTGFQQSAVLGAYYRFERVDGPHDSWVYTLHERE